MLYPVLKNYRIPLIVFLVLFLQGASVGLSDDEAYYWALSQKLALSYAYHPPAVAWIIRLFHVLFGWIPGLPPQAIVRLPAAFSIAIILNLILKWLQAQVSEHIKLTRAVLVILSFFGFFSLSWMMVPDIPLFLGWTLLFVTTWKICFSNSSKFDFGLLAGSASLILLSKYSGILAIFSSFVAILLWSKKVDSKIKALFALAVGVVVALIPILIWNSQHEWASILYQIRDRHGGGQVSWVRFLRFWVVESLLAGPLLIGYGFYFIGKTLYSIQDFKNEVKNNTSTKLNAYITLWIVPPAFVFCLQPLVSDFKLHWVFVVWLPMAIALAIESQGSKWNWIRLQVVYGLFMGTFILLCCQLPIGTWIGNQISGAGFDPRLDVTNDLYGWSDLKFYFEKNLLSDVRGLPVIGSRYQTASQAAFSLNGISQVALIPRDIKDRDEWPDLNISDGIGPSWPKLVKPVLYVTDNRYTALPEFPGAKCVSIGKLETKRFHLPAKWIEIWKCDP